MDIAPRTRLLILRLQYTFLHILQGAGGPVETADSGAAVLTTAAMVATAAEAAMVVEVVTVATAAVVRPLVFC